MIRMLIAVALLAGMGASYAVAQMSDADVIKERQAIMKAMSKAGKTLTTMTKGEAPFDATAVQAAFTEMQAGAAKSKDLYPASTKSGDHRSLPAIWEKKDEFVAKFDKFGADLKTAAAASKDLDGLKASVKGVFANCGACHKPYRAPKK